MQRDWDPKQISHTGDVKVTFVLRCTGVQLLCLHPPMSLIVYIDPSCFFWCVVVLQAVCMCVFVHSACGCVCVCTHTVVTLACFV